MAAIPGVMFVAGAAGMWWAAWEERKDGVGWGLTYIVVGLACAAVGVALIVGR